MRRRRPCMLTVIGRQYAASGPAETVRLLQYRVEHRREFVGRGIDDLQHLRGCSLLRQRVVALGGALVELALQLRVGALQIGYRLVERRGHLLIPSGRGSSTS